MIKLYKIEDDRILYWETWESNKIHTVHWGEVGTPGETEELKSTPFKKAEDRILKDIAQMRSRGFSEIPIEDHATLIIEYAVDGMGTSQDLTKRHNLQDGMDTLLGWAGLGHCDGGSIGSGTMEVYCFVVDFAIAKSLLEAELPKSPFADYTRIYKE